MNGKINILGFGKALLGLLLPLVMGAQQSNIDSLENLLCHHTIKDTIRINLLIKLGESKISNDIEKADDYIQNIKMLSDSLDHQWGQVAYLRLKAYKHTLKAEHKIALTLLYTALKKSENSGFSKESVKILMLIGGFYFRADKYYKALEIYQKALGQSEEIRDNVFTVTLLGSIALIHLYLREYDHALEYSNKGLKLAEMTCDKARECWILSNISDIYKKKGEYKKALVSAKKSLVLARELDLKMTILQALTNLGNINNEMGRYEQALTYYEKGIDMGELTKSHWFLCEARLGLATAKHKLGHQVAARKAAKHAMAMATDSVNNFTVLKSAISLLLADIAAATGDHKAAYSYYREHKLLSDKLVNEENLKKVANLERKNAFKTEKERLKAEQERQAGLHEATIRQQVQKRRAMIGVAIVLLAFTVVIVYALDQKRKANRLLAEQQNNIKVSHEAVQELDLFKHTMMERMENDLKESLDTVVKLDGKSLWEGLLKARQSGMQMFGTITNMLDIYKYGNLKSDLRKDAHQLMAIAEDAISDVLPMAKSAVANIENHKAKNKMLHIKNQITPGLDVHCERNLIRRVFTNLLDNAVEHSPMGGTIIIGATRANENTIEVKLTDQGTGIDETLLASIFESRSNDNDNFKGNGLAFCKLAVEAHGGTIWARNNKGQGMSFTFTLEPTEGFERAMGVSTHNGTGTLGEGDKKILRPYLEALSNISVYEVGRFKEVISKLPIDIGPIAQWREGLEESVRQLDGEQYERLLKIDGET